MPKPCACGKAKTRMSIIMLALTLAATSVRPEMVASDLAYVQGTIVAALFSGDGSAQWFDVKREDGRITRIYPTWCVAWGPGVVIKAHIAPGSSTEVDSIEVTGWHKLN